MTTAINFDFATAFVSISILGHEPTFRFVYEPEFMEHYDDVVICYDKEGNITGFGKAHGRYINIDEIVEDDNWDEEEYYNPFSTDDLKDIPGEGKEIWSKIMNTKGEYRYLEEDIFDWFDIVNIPDLGAFLPEDVFDI